MVDTEQGSGENTNRRGTATDILAGAREDSTEVVVEQVREHGPNRTVSEESVDDVLDELDGESNERSEENDGEQELVGGGPTTTVADDGIDEVFEKLASKAADAPAAERSSEGEDDVGAPSGSEEVNHETGSDDAKTAAENEDYDGTDGGLAGGGPTRTVSEESVDDVLATVSGDADYATFDEVSDVDVDPDAVLPDSGSESDSRTDQNAPRSAATDQSGADLLAGVEDEHTPEEDADGLCPDEADTAVVDLLTEAAASVDRPEDGGATVNEGALSASDDRVVGSEGSGCVSGTDGSSETECSEWTDGVPESARPVEAADDDSSPPFAKTGDERTSGDAERFASARYVRSLAGWFRSLLARL
jgi:hypothetical protein